jgi:hypothetical protein
MRLAVTTGGWGKPRQIETDPDSDVRAAAAHPRGGPHGKRLRQLARSLLSLKVVPVVLLTLASPMSACVVPVAPNFQDPIGEPNVPPYIANAMPAVGSFVPNNTGAFTVTVTDQNVGDTLSYRWVIDYPPFSLMNTRPQAIQTILPSANGTQQSNPESLASPCDLNPAQTIAVHQLEFILADRAFDTTDPKVLDALPQESDGFVVRANWTFSCP